MHFLLEHNILYILGKNYLILERVSILLKLDVCCTDPGPIIPLRGGVLDTTLCNKVCQ